MIMSHTPKMVHHDAMMTWSRDLSRHWPLGPGYEVVRGDETGGGWGGWTDRATDACVRGVDAKGHPREGAQMRVVSSYRYIPDSRAQDTSQVDVTDVDNTPNLVVKMRGAKMQITNVGPDGRATISVPLPGVKSHKTRILESPDGKPISSVTMTYTAAPVGGQPAVTITVNGEHRFGVAPQDGYIFACD